MKAVATVAALGLAASLAACAPMATPESMQLASSSGSQAQTCFYMNQVTGYRNASQSSLLVTASLGRTFEADFIGRCLEMNPTVSISIKPEKAVSSRLCGGDYASLTTHSVGEGEGQCRIRVVRLLSEEEAASSLRGSNGYRTGRTSGSANS